MPLKRSCNLARLLGKAKRHGATIDGAAPSDHRRLDPLDTADLAVVPIDHRARCEPHRTKAAAHAPVDQARTGLFSRMASPGSCGLRLGADGGWPGGMCYTRIKPGIAEAACPRQQCFGGHPNDRARRQPNTSGGVIVSRGLNGVFRAHGQRNAKPALTDHGIANGNAGASGDGWAGSEITGRRRRHSRHRPGGDAFGPASPRAARRQRGGVSSDCWQLSMRPRIYRAC